MGISRLNPFRKRETKRNITTLEAYAAALNHFIYNGSTYPLTGIQSTLPGEPRETISNSLESYAQSAYASNGVVFACMAVRQLIFSSVRFSFQRFRNGRPADLWSDRSLQVLEQPWPGGTTQDLLSRQIQDADLAGNFYSVTDTPLSRLGANDGAEIVRLRPDWLEIVLQPRFIGGQQVGYRRVGYAYYEGGRHAGNDPALFDARDVTHFAPYPDPLASYRGMSWLTPVIREIQSDGLMTKHKRKFFENAATPNVIVRMDPAVTLDQFKEFVEEMDDSHKGVDDAYKTLYVGAAADVTVAGSNFEQMDFKVVQGAGETRIAAAAGMHPVIVGLSEGMQGSSLNAGNYAQIRRRVADGTMHPLWQNAAGSWAPVVRPPDDSRLWYDTRSVPFLRDDMLNIAEIQAKQAVALRQLTDAGYDPDASVEYLQTDDLSALTGSHSGLFSVQLQPPGAGNGDDPARMRVTADELRELLSKGWAPVRSDQPLELEAA